MVKKQLTYTRFNFNSGMNLFLTGEGSNLTNIQKHCQTFFGLNTIVRKNDDLEKTPEVLNLLGIYSSLSNQNLDKVKSEFEGKNFSLFTDTLSELLVGKSEPIGKEINDLLNDEKYLDQINNFFNKNRKNQNKYWLLQTINDKLQSNFFSNEKIKKELEKQYILLDQNKTTPFSAAEILLKI